MEVWFLGHLPAFSGANRRLILHSLFRILENLRHSTSGKSVNMNSVHYHKQKQYSELACTTVGSACSE
jgi:hypothetical protein